MHNPSVDSSLESLYLLVQKDDRSAFDRLYERTWKDLYTRAFARLGDADLTQDILQEVYIDIWNKRNARDIRQVEAYLYNAVKYKVIDCFRANKYKFEVIDDFVEIIADSEYADSSFAAKELRAIISCWMEQLPKKRREIVKSKLENDLSTAEISELLNISPKTVQNQYLNSKAELKVLLKKIFTFFLGV
ncbi:RNA polymerase sigma factor [Sphingobacterium tabacisoli]|uniref:RNA polymerase sigma factor n=1 Tax=Sphingobacterium tabacisoli TaxID=2044855 RepID=A0ABW5L3Z2_9SPHI|nr:sigma-70 family RNA polymerase sigma factor [Sphingobacterium tabacisoli]